MKISTKIRYGLRALINIAEGNLNEERLVKIKEISKKQNISVQYLEQILFRLKKKGIIKGKRGPGGGYRITRDPKEVTILELYNILDDEIKVVDCDNEANKHCAKEGCRTHGLWAKLDTTLKQILAETTLEELMNRKA